MPWHLALAIDIDNDWPIAIVIGIVIDIVDMSLSTCDVAVDMSLSTCRCRHVAVNMSLSTCRCRHVPVDMSLSTCRCRHVAVDMLLSTCHCHLSIIIIMVLILFDFVSNYFSSVTQSESVSDSV